MVSSDRQAAQLASTLAWLEDTTRENKALVARLQQQVEQSQTQVWDLTHRLHRAEEVASALATQLGSVPRLEEQITAVTDKIVRAEDRQTVVDGRLVELSRQQQLDADRERAEVNELHKRVEGWERLTQSWSSRLDSLEEASRRTQEASSLLRQRVEDFERFVEAVDQRGSRVADALKRVDNEFARVSAEIDVLQKQDATLFERIQVYAEVVKRFDEELAVVAQQSDVRREFAEKFELYRTGIRRSEERLNMLEALDNELRERIEDHQRALALLETRDRAFRDRLAALQTELAEYRTHVADHFQKTQTVVEKQRRRRIEDLEREIRELKVNAYRPPEEP